MKYINTLIFMLVAFSISAMAEIKQGTAGENVFYEFNTETGVLHVYGNGPMTNFKGISYATSSVPTTYYYPKAPSSPVNGFNSQVTSVVIDEGVTTVGAAFCYNCPNLTSVTLPNSLEVIDYEAFRRCPKLTSISLGPNVKSVKARSFTDCGKLASITVDESNPYLVSNEGVLYTANYETLLRFPEGLNKLEYVIPEGTRNCDTDALYQLKYVTTITVPSSMTVIDYGSFDNSSKLTTMIFRSMTPPTFGKKDAVGITLKNIYVPCGAEKNYKNSSSWSGFNIKSISGTMMVDFRVSSNDLKLGDVKVTQRADCNSEKSTIQAVPTAYGTFSHWQDGSTQNPRVVDLTGMGSQTVIYTAYFEPKTFTITVKKGSSFNNAYPKYQVSVTNTADETQTATTTGSETQTSYKFKYGDVVTLFCDVQAGRKFTNWGEDGSNDNPHTITVTKNATYTAYISDGNITIETAPSDKDQGSTTPAKTEVKSGETVTISATPKAGYQFLKWDDGDTNATRDVVASASKKYIAYFTIAKYTVAADVNDNAMGSVTGYGTFPAGTKVKLVATPNDNYTFVGWSGDITSAKQEVEISSLMKNYNVKATFKPVQFTITYKYPDGKVIGTEKLDYNTMPAPADPSMTSTAQYHYTFKEWSPALATVTKDATYTAVFSSELRSYTVRFVNGKEELQSTVEKYNTTPIYKGKTPTKDGGKQFTYTFSGWDKKIAPVTGDVTYTAQFESTVNTYGILFVDENGSPLTPVTQVEYGKMPPLPETPTKASDEQYDYKFDKWNPTVVAVDGEATYTASYTKTLRKYTITFKDGDGKVLGTPIQVEYGKKPAYTGATPTKTQDAQFTYTFNKKWSPEITAVTGDQTYTAQFDAVTRSYEVVFKNNGTVLQKQTVKYGDTPVYSGKTPTKSADKQTTYKWNGWTPSIVAVTGNATYEATFVKGDAVLYHISFVNFDGTVLHEKDYEYEAMPDYNVTPTYGPTKDEVFTFDKWSPSVTKVTEDKVYTATYTKVPRKYTITFVDENKTTILDQSDVEYGVKPTYNKALPTKASTAEYTYTFKQWTPEIVAVEGDATYVAEYSQAKNKYTVTFVDYNNSTIKTESVEYGKSATPPANPTRTGYTFDKWIGSYTDVKKAETVTASYIINKYTIIFKNDDGTVLDKQVIDYNETPSYVGIPEKAATAKYSYTFKSWDKNVVPAVADETYTATYNQTINTYKIVFYAADGKTPLQTSMVEYDQMPKYTKATPTKAATVKNTFKFSDWSPVLTAVTGDAEYYPLFTETINEYEITFLDSDGKPLANGTKMWQYGETPYYQPEPTKASDEKSDYVFNGWDPQLRAVDGNETYKAKYLAVTRSYDVVFVDYDGKELQRKPVLYGLMPSYDGEEPSRTSDKFNTYTFTGWTPQFTAVKGEQKYTATYSNAAILFDITFKDYDGTVLATKKVAPEEVITYTGTPTRDDEPCCTYTFDGWSPALTSTTTATQSMTFTAKYKSTDRTYSVRFEMDDHSEIMTQKVKYGAMPKVPADPVKEQTESHSYTFTGWNKKVEAVEGDVTYTATFSSTLREYQITFKDYDGKVLYSEKLDYGVMPQCSEPTRAADGYNTYEFHTWQPSVTTVSKDAEYVASYTATAIKYLITFKNHDGTVLQSTEMYYNETPVYAGIKPTKKSEVDKDYTFAGWDKDIVNVKEPATYTAKFNASPRKYDITFADDNGSTITVESVEYGTVPSYHGTEPVKAATSSTWYKFAGWTPEFVEVTGEATYTATFDAFLNEYTVIFKNSDGSVIQDSKWKHGTVPVCAVTPTKAADAENTYYFDKWDRTVVEATADAVYTAEFTSKKNSYKITFVDYNDAVLQQSYVEYGKVPAYAGETPTRPTVDHKSYTFLRWTPSVETVTKDATYKATYSDADVIYTIRFEDYDGTELQTSKFVAHAAIECDIVPTRQMSASTVYKFSGWNPELTVGMTAIKDMTFRAKYDESARAYTVRFVMDNGDEITSQTVDYNVMPVVPADPVKAQTESENFSFSGWDKKVEPVKGDVTYTATFSSSTRQFQVTFLDYDGKVLYSDKLDYGVTPQCAAPTRAADGYNTYEFNSWSPSVTTVSKDIEYIATYNSTAIKYLITFQNYDGTVLQTDEMYYEEKPEYSGTKPVKASGVDYDYTFSGWNKDIVKVKESTTYIAQFTASFRKYDITFADDEGNVITTETVEYGTMPSYNGAEPVKSATSSTWYKFAGWTPEFVEVTGEATYTATFDAFLNEYTVIFKNSDGSVIQESKWKHGSMPVCAVTPTKDADAENTYYFEKWDCEVVAATADAVYTAVYTSKTNTYKITFVNYNDAILQQSEVEYGKVPVYTGETPTQPSNNHKTYTFLRWTPSVETVTKEATYKAIFTDADEIYTIRFEDYDGTELQTSKFEAMAEIECNIIPTRQMTESTVYKFRGWNPEFTEGMKATKDMTFKAEYDESARIYNIRFVMDNGDEIATVATEYGKMPVAPADVKKAADGQNSYVFDSWTPLIVAVDGDATYKAKFKATLLKFTVEFVDYNGKTIKKSEYEYGATPSCDAPSRKADEQYTYTFAGWDKQVVAVTADAKYTATYKTTVNKYVITVACNDNKLGNVSGGGEYEYGTKVTLTAKADEKAKFVKWTDGEIKAERTVEVKADATYTAEFASDLKKVTVKFVNYDGTLIKSVQVEEGSVITTDLVPSREPSVDKQYKFFKWEPYLYDGFVATEDITFTAVYLEQTRQYLVRYVWDDGVTEIMSGYFDYGSMPDYPMGFKKPNDKVNNVSYTFMGWSPTYGEVTGDVTYVAQFIETALYYNVNFYNYDGMLLRSWAISEGVLPSCETPTRPSDNDYSYVFIGWDKPVVPAVEDVDYYAQYEQVARKCNVTVTPDYPTLGSTTGSGLYENGDKVTITATAKEGGKFVGWTDGSSESVRTITVTGDMKFVAMFEGNIFVVPEDPNNPGGNEDPNNPGGNEDPNNPGHNEDPNNPGNNEDPNNPGNNEDPNTPGGNEDPNNPGNNEDPNKPGGNEDPNNPGNNEDPNNPGNNENPNTPGGNEDPQNPGEEEYEEPIPIVPDPESPCYMTAYAEAYYDWLLVLDNKKMRLMGYKIDESQVKWYRIVGEQDDECGNMENDDEVVSEGFYYTSDHNLLGTGMYYAVVDADGMLFRTRVFDFSTANKAMILPNRAKPGQSLEIKGIDGVADIQVYDISGRLVNTYRTDGSCTFTIDAERTAGVYVVRVLDANGSVLKYLVK